MRSKLPILSDVFDSELALHESIGSKPHAWRDKTLRILGQCPIPGPDRWRRMRGLSCRNDVDVVQEGNNGCAVPEQSTACTEPCGAREYILGPRRAASASGYLPCKIAGHMGGQVYRRLQRRQHRSPGHMLKGPSYLHV